MARLFLALAVLVMLTCARSVDAGTWHPIKQSAWLFAAQGDNGVVASFDANSVQRVRQSVVRAWIKYKYVTPQPNPVNIYGPEYVKAEDLEYFDCSAQTATEQSWTFYTSKGGVAASSDVDGSVAHIVPGTVLASVFNAVCGWAMK